MSIATRTFFSQEHSFSHILINWLLYNFFKHSKECFIWEIFNQLFWRTNVNNCFWPWIWEKLRKRKKQKRSGLYQEYLHFIIAVIIKGCTQSYCYNYCWDNCKKAKKYYRCITQKNSSFLPWHHSLIYFSVPLLYHWKIMEHDSKMQTSNKKQQQPQRANRKGSFDDQ